MPSNGYFLLLRKTFKKQLRNNFLLCMLAEIVQLLLEISSFPEVLYKNGILKNFSNLQVNTRSSHQEVFCQKGFHKNCAKFTGKHLCRSLFFKVTGWKPETIKSSHWRCSVKKGVFKNFINFTSDFLWNL